MIPQSAARLLLALHILTAAPDTPAPAFHPMPLAPLREAALTLELMDPREWAFSVGAGYDSDLRMLRDRWAELRTAPPLSECRRLPAREVAVSMLTWNRAYRTWLVDRLGYDSVHREEIEAAIEETEQLYRAWDLVRDCQCAYYHVPIRRQALLQLRELMGPAAFARGAWPVPLPLHRLPRE